MLKIKQAGLCLAQIAMISAMVVSFTGSAAKAEFSPELKALIAKAAAEKELSTSWGHTTVGGLPGAKAIAKAMKKNSGSISR